MIISKTPYRISFFGGGTDYPFWFNEHGGAVLSTAIDKYCYITCRQLPPFFDHATRIVYSKIEMVNDIEEIRHPAVRESLRYLKLFKGLEIHHDGDLPAKSGIGSSSSFTVGLLNSLYALMGKMVTREKLSKDAIFVEQQMIKETVGCQDQIIAANGGIKNIVFHPDDQVSINQIVMTKERLEDFQNHLLLCYTGVSRYSSKVSKKFIKNGLNNIQTLKEIRKMVDEAVNLLYSDTPLSCFGKLLHESWLLKRTLSNQISNEYIDEIYHAAISEGAYGGKILGAGGGGFLLLFAKKEVQAKIREKLKNFLFVPVKIEPSGSQIIFYDKNYNYPLVKN